MQKQDEDSLWVDLYLPDFHMLTSSASAHENVALFENRVITDVIC